VTQRVFETYRNRKRAKWSPLTGNPGRHGPVRAGGWLIAQLKPAAAWARPFDDPILLDGRELLTLRDAADFIMKLPKAEQDLEEWQTAIGCLIGAAEGRDFVMHARIGVLRALNRNVERTLTDRKEMHWGRRKRDQQ
jgi:hypothetical protein